MPHTTKIMSLNQLVHDFIPNGSHIYLEGLLTNRLPMAAVHEIIRKNLRDLRLTCAPNGLAVDQLIGAGTIAEIEFYFLGFMVPTGFASMHRFREAARKGTIHLKESMGYAVCMGLRAGAFGLPFIPIPDFRGSDLLKIRKDYVEMPSPYNANETVITVPAIRPDVLLFHAHSADKRGNVFLDEPWTNFILTTAQACSKVLVTVEEIVETGSIPLHRITIPHFLVDAISLVPYGAVPSALNRRYEVDTSHITLYQKAAQTQEGFDQYLKEYIFSCQEHQIFLHKIGVPQSWFRNIPSQTRRGTKA